MRYSVSRLILTTIFLFVIVLSEKTVIGQISDITSVSWSADGSKIAVGRNDGTIQIQNAVTGQVTFTLQGDTNGATLQIIFSPDVSSSKFASGGVDGLVKVWDASTGSLLYSLSGHNSVITGLSWNPINTQFLASASYDGTIKIWNSATGSLVTTMGQARATILGLAWSPDASKLVAGGGTSLAIWNANTGAFISNYPGSNGEISAVNWGENSNALVSSATIGALVIWNPTTGAVINNLTGDFTNTPGSLNALAISPDGNKIATAGFDNTIRIWSTTGVLIQRIATGSAVVGIAWNPNGSKLAYGGVGGSLQIVNLGFKTGTGLRGQYYDTADVTTGLKFFRINPTINFNWANASPDTTIAADTFSVRWTGKVEPLYSETYTFYTTHNDGARLWVNGQPLINDWVNRTTAVERSGTITLAAGVKYDLVLEYYENTGNASLKLEWSSPSQARQVIPVAQLYPPEGQLAFRGAAGGNEEVYVRNPDGSGELNLSNSTALDHNPVWSPDGTQIAFVSTRDGNEEIYLVNADGTGLRRLTNNTAADNQPAWSPDGTKLAFISQRSGSGNIYIITVAGTSGVPTPALRVSSTYSEANVMWSPNGLWLTYDAYVNSTYGVEVFIVSSTSGSPIRLTTRSGIDAAPFWSPDGSKVAFRAPFGGADQIWTVLTASPYTITRLTDLGNNHFQSWSPDGTKILFQSNRDGNNEVYTMTADGNNETRLTNSPESESYAVWSADARQIAFVRGGDIWLMNADGSNPRNDTNTPTRTESQIVWWQTKQSS